MTTVYIKISILKRRNNKLDYNQILISLNMYDYNIIVYKNSDNLYIIHFGFANYFNKSYLFSNLLLISLYVKLLYLNSI